MTKYFFGEREFLVFPHCGLVYIELHAVKKKQKIREIYENFVISRYLRIIFTPSLAIVKKQQIFREITLIWLLV